MSTTGFVLQRRHGMSTTGGVQDGIQPPRMDGLNEACGLAEAVADNPFGDPETFKKSKPSMRLRRRGLSDVGSLASGLKVLPLEVAVFSVRGVSCTDASLGVQKSPFFARPREAPLTPLRCTAGDLATTPEWVLCVALLRFLPLLFRVLPVWVAGARAVSPL
jgi:hypothetical protein